MSYDLPPPPGLKATIIQLNKDLDQDNGNFEILTNYNGSSQRPRSLNEMSEADLEARDQLSPVMSAINPKKKRRRSSTNIPKEELDKRKSETKQLHSIIEKRRRIKINREFEALKYLIPACRTNNANSTTTTPNLSPKMSSNNNSKIDGMYKLTILKSSVEYILYLHHLIQKQLEAISSLDPDFDFDCSFSKFPLNVNDYRNIDKEFNFKSLVQQLESKTKELDEDDEDDDEYNGNDNNDNNEDGDLNEDNEDDDSESFQLPSPIITPDMPPTKFKYNSKFHLPDPAVLPRKKYFKSLPKDIMINGPSGVLSSGSHARGEVVPSSREDGDDNNETTASKTLLSLRKSSIDSLLN